MRNYCCSVAKSRPILQPHGLQHARLPCPSPSPGVSSNSRPLSRWCHPTISSSVSLFSCPRSFPAPGSFPMSFDSSHQVAKYVSVLASVLPMNIRGWFPLEWTGLISSLSRDDSGHCLPKIFVPKCFIHNFSVYLRATPWGRYDLFI